MNTDFEFKSQSVFIRVNQCPFQGLIGRSSKAVQWDGRII